MKPSELIPEAPVDPTNERIDKLIKILDIIEGRVGRLDGLGLQIITMPKGYKITTGMLSVMERKRQQEEQRCPF